MDIEQKLSNLSFVRGDKFYKSAGKWGTTWDVIKKGPKYLDELLFRGGTGNASDLIQSGTKTDKIRMGLNAGQLVAGQAHGQAGDRDHYGSASYFADKKGLLSTNGDLSGGTKYSPDLFKQRYGKQDWFKKEFPTGNVVGEQWARKYKTGEEMAPSFYDRASGGLTGLALGSTKSRRWMFNKDIIGKGFWKPVAKLGAPPALGFVESVLDTTKNVNDTTKSIDNVGENIGKLPDTLDSFVKNIKEFGAPLKKYALPFAGSAVGSALGAAGGHLLSKDTSGMSEEKRREEERRQRQRKALMTLGGLGLGGLGGAYIGGAFDDPKAAPSN